MKLLTILMSMTTAVWAQEYPNIGLIVTAPSAPDDSYIMANLSQFVKSTSWNENLPTILYSYGYTEKMNSSSIQRIMKAYHLRGGYNFLAVNWAEYNDGLYNTVRAKMMQIGNNLGKKLWEMHSQGLINLTKWHFIGHSLGSHIVGYIARSITAASANNFKIKRLTALDPAGPMMYDVYDFMKFKPLWMTDAELVDVVHTDKLMFGTSWKVGHIEFWVNGALHQPGCPRFDVAKVSDLANFCSHQRSTELYAESVANLNDDKTFPAVDCRRSGILSLTKTCNQSKIAYMGFHLDPKTEHGSYYLNTKAESPYNKGLDGIKAVSFDEYQENENELN